MPTEGTAAERPPGPLIGFLCAALLVAFPLALWSAAASRGGDADIAMATGVTIAVPGPRPVTTATAAQVEPTPAPSVARDARTLLELFRQKDYRIEAVRDGSLAVPRLMTVDLPSDLDSLDDPDTRKAVFLKTMLPLVLIANERIERDRARLANLHARREAGERLSPKDRMWLAWLAERYGIDASGTIDTKTLLRRVDVVPVSLTLAQAAEESGWGTSRFAQKGNALFGQLTWSASHKGITPRNRQAGENHRFRSFDDLMGSVEAYMHNLNTHGAYLEFRRMRAGLRAKGKPLDGAQLAGALGRYSERGADYVRAIRAVMRTADLGDFDRAVLRQGEPAQVLRMDVADRR